ncbi:DUF58 domain-containing protein [Ilumatobacter sp.]|uniref:DUF58 domain-containing protein n=1 Tax=Ilumatobacter sp. TaxID=1967498 RepID=UPI0037502925
MKRLLATLKIGASMVTVLGWTVGALGVVAWVAGFVWGWQEMMVIAGGSLLLGAIAVALTLGRLDLSSTIEVSPSRVVVGERAAGALTVTNKRSRTARGLRVEMPVGKAIAAYSLASLKGGDATDELFIVPTNRRAVISVGPVATVKGDPLGLMRRTETWGGVEEIYVHPKTVPLSTMAAGLIRDMEGQATPQLSPSDVAFHTLREYVAGDDRRHIHWKSSAKIGNLMVRQYVDTRRSHVAVLLSIDLDDYADADEFELGVSCAASAAMQALRDEQTLSLFAGGRQLVAENPKRMLDRFSAIEATRGAGGLDHALTAARTLAADASVAVLCVGSAVPIANVRRSATRMSLDATGIVLRADFEAKPGYQVIGTTKFVNVPALDALGRGVAAVIS